MLTTFPHMALVDDLYFFLSSFPLSRAFLNNVHVYVYHFNRVYLNHARWPYDHETWTH